MSLTDRPLTRLLPDPGQPFVVYAVWVNGDKPMSTHPPYGVPDDGRVYFSAANLPGGPLAEFAVGGKLAEAMSQVWAEELPIALTLHLAEVDGRGEWVFDFLGQSDRFPEIWRVPPDVQPQGPTPLTPDELNQGAEDMLRESLGIPDGEPLPEPGGPLSGEETAVEPYRFDPTRHMDLDRAEAPPPLPPPAPPGPPPPPDAQTSPLPPLPPPQQKDHGAFGDASVPFGH